MKNSDTLILVLGGVVGAVVIYYAVIKPAQAASSGINGLASGAGSVASSIGNGLSLLVNPSTWSTLLSGNDGGTIASTDTNVADASGANGQTAASAAHSAAIISGLTDYSPYTPAVPATQSPQQQTGGGNSINCPGY